MSEAFIQEVETGEKLNQLHRKIFEVEGGEDEPSKVEMLLTLTVDFQLKIETYCTVDMYPQQKRKLFGWPWCVLADQDEAFKVWIRVP